MFQKSATSNSREATRPWRWHTCRVRFSGSGRLAVDVLRRLVLHCSLPRASKNQSSLPRLPPVYYSTRIACSACAFLRSLAWIAEQRKRSKDEQPRGAQVRGGGARPGEELDARPRPPAPQPRRRQLRQGRRDRRDTGRHAGLLLHGHRRRVWGHRSGVGRHRQQETDFPGPQWRDEQQQVSGGHGEKRQQGVVPVGARGRDALRPHLRPRGGARDPRLEEQRGGGRRHRHGGRADLGQRFARAGCAVRHHRRRAVRRRQRALRHSLGSSSFI